MRDGAIREIPRREVVVGDVVYVESGETVPADGELVEAVSLKINESTLTGEPEVDKTVDEAHFDPVAIGSIFAYNCTERDCFFHESVI